MEHTDPAYWQGLIKMGLTKLYMLRALLDGPSHGYDLARRAEALSRGTCAPTEGTIYPVLREWETEGLVTGAWEVVRGRKRRVYVLTAAGRAAYRAACAVWVPAAVSVGGLTEPEDGTGELAPYLL